MLKLLKVVLRCCSSDQKTISYNHEINVEKFWHTGCCSVMVSYRIDIDHTKSPDRAFWNIQPPHFPTFVAIFYDV